MPPRRRTAPARDTRTEGGEARATPVARPGSTTYDGSASTEEDPPWDGAQWVGADSGTYWTINPREYADPRKHGPEYRARGRRPIRRDGRGAPAGRGESSRASAGPAFDATGPLPGRAGRDGARILALVAAVAVAILAVRFLLAMPPRG